MKHDKLSVIGLRILELRKAKKRSLRKLAKRSGLSAGRLSQIEHFRTVPSLSVLVEIANSLEVDVVMLVRNILPQAVQAAAIYWSSSGDT